MNPKRGVLGLGALLILAACGGTTAPPSNPPTSSAGVASITPAESQSSGAGGGSSAVRGYDCATLLSPAELDKAAGLQGGTVTTNHRGDQPSAGEVPGVTECGIEVPAVSNWAGSFHVYTGDEALGNFEAIWDLAKQNGAVALAGVGGDAVILSTPELGVHGYVRGNGVALDIGVSWDDQSTTEQAVTYAVKAILATVLSRT